MSLDLAAPPIAMPNFFELELDPIVTLSVPLIMLALGPIATESFDKLSILALSPIAVELLPLTIAPGPYTVFADATPPHITIATITAATLLPASEVTTDLTLDLPSRFAISDTTTQAFLVFDHITLYI